MKNKLTLDSKVIFINRIENNFNEKYIHEQTIGWYLEQMSITNRREDILVQEWFYQDLDESWKVEVILSAIRSWLCWLYEYDDITYIVKDNEVHFDRLRVKNES